MSLGMKAGCTLLKSTPTALAKPAQLALPPSVRGPRLEIIVVPSNYRTHRDRAAAEMVWHRGLENLVAQGLWGTETPCQVHLSEVYSASRANPGLSSS
jgi:putative transposase